ncbi:expressed protein [Phakopsora pachyrhizi]|uniref:Expressed protein n=1 Tax=Phakopsora pachyrhizi TaxID=170000 RepID=A0AAV0AR58_PHAPC|nr:expressed protein [Phakopsora pachyrhizi]CAH7671731.1 expressed protein [Phakopsora pachyrhizi]
MGFDQTSLLKNHELKISPSKRRKMMSSLGENSNTLKSWFINRNTSSDHESRNIFRTVRFSTLFDQNKLIKIYHKESEEYADYDCFEKYNCGICLEELIERKVPKMSKLPNSEEIKRAYTSVEFVVVKIETCSHLFHQSCLFEWFKRSETCPYCRA